MEEKRGHYMSFCTAINCMDGRVQLPVTEYMKRKSGAEYVDMITEPGPNLVLAERADENLVNSIMARVNISVNHHGSRMIAVTGHHDCAGNPAEKDDQFAHTKKAMTVLSEYYPDVELVGLWVDENWSVSEIEREA